MVELQPSKLVAWVRFPSPAPQFIIYLIVANENKGVVNPSAAGLQTWLFKTTIESQLCCFCVQQSF